MDKPGFTRRATIGMVAATTVAGATAAQQQGETAMERVQGIGGFFFRAKDPKKLAEWYRARAGGLWRHGLAYRSGYDGLRAVRAGHDLFRRSAPAMDDQFPRSRSRQDGRPASRRRHPGRH